MKIDRRILIAAVLLTALVLGLVQVFLIPPFQNPDEIQHFLYSAASAYSPKQLETIEARVLERLKEYRWFHFVGFGPGWENIKKISEVSFVFHFDLNRESARNTLFHFLYGKILKISGISGELNAFYFLRLVSTFFYLLTIVSLTWFSLTYFPKEWVYYLVGFLLVFQLTTIMNAVNYDVLMVFLGSIFFMFAYRYFHWEKTADFAGLLITAAVATLIKLTGIMFFGVLFILLFIKVKCELKLM